MKLSFSSSVVVALFSLCVFNSCQQGVDDDLPTNPDPVDPPAVADSTQLIKSITYYLYQDDGSYIRDSITETYNYDTINRKIKLQWSVDNSPSDDYSATLSYSKDGKLEKAEWFYPPSHTITDWDPGMLTLSYDAEGTLHQIVMKKANGESKTRGFLKTMLLSGGHQLEFDEQEYFTGVTWHHVDKFDATGRRYFYSYQYTYDTGLGLTTTYAEDSLAYDAQGSVVRAHGRYTNSISNTDERYISFEFSGRETKGQQLSNQRRLLYNKELDFEFITQSDEFSGALGILSYFNGDEDMYEYMKYPIKSATVQLYDKVATFNASSEFDSLDRLVRFNGYTPDTDLIPVSYRIVYYK